MRGSLVKRIRREVEEEYYWLEPDHYLRLNGGQVVNTGLRGVVRRVKNKLKNRRRYGG